MRMKGNQKQLGWLFSTLRNSLWLVLVLLVLQVLQNICMIEEALILRRLIDAAVSGEFARFTHRAYDMAAITVLQILFRCLERWLQELTASTAENNLKRSLFRTLLRKDYASVTAVHSGEWMNRFTEDTSNIAKELVQLVPGFCGMVVRLVGSMILLYGMMSGFFGVLLPIVAVVVVLTLLLRGKLKRLYKRIREKDGVLRVFLSERLENLMLLRAFSQERNALRGADERMADHKSARMRRNLYANVANTGFSFFLKGLYAAGAIWCGYGVVTKTITYGTVSAVLYLLAGIQAPMFSISGYLPRYYSVIASAERLMEAEILPEEAGSEALEPAQIRAYYEDAFRSIEFRNVGFSYPKKPNETEIYSVMTQMNLVIHKGEFIALTGPSGCGKSTLIRLLLSLYHPTAGEIMLCGKDGEEPLERKHRGLFAYVPQGNQLMSGTIRSLMTFDGEAAQSDDTLWNALRLACADDFIVRMENGLDTVLGERGAGLSEGQLQRLAIARALCSSRPILLLDESTSSLDAELEQKLLHNLRTMTDKTVLLVSHRPAALSFCDTVLSLDGPGKES